MVLPMDQALRLDDVDAILTFAQHLREREDQGALVWMRRAARKGHPLAPGRRNVVGGVVVVVDDGDNNNNN